MSNKQAVLHERDDKLTKEASDASAEEESSEERDENNG